MRKKIIGRSNYLMQLKRLKATTLGSQKLILKMHYATGRKNLELKIWKSGLKNTISNRLGQLLQ